MRLGSSKEPEHAVGEARGQIDARQVDGIQQRRGDPGARFGGPGLEPDPPLDLVETEVALRGPGHQHLIMGPDELLAPHIREHGLWHLAAADREHGPLDVPGRVPGQGEEAVRAVGAIDRLDLGAPLEE